VLALKITRRVGEAVVLPSLGITVRLLEVSGGSVRFGVEVPPGVPVARADPPARLAPILARATRAGSNALGGLTG
jgi:sRNA-binding carbon storage regulator CsrA